MKRYLNKIIFLTGSGVILLTSCEKNQSYVFFNGGQAPVLSSNVSADSIPLPVTDTTAPAVTFNWTNPNYTFSNGISSLNVTYYLQFDTAGANFKSQNMQTIGITSDLSSSFTVSTLNTVLANGLLLSTGVPHSVQVRIESSIQPSTSGSAPVGVLYSNTLNYTLIPYAPPPAINPPSNDSLYIVGSAVMADNWANPMPPASIPAERFTAVSATEFRDTIALVGGGEYKFINVNGSWSGQWSVASNDTYPTGGPFVFNGSNCIAPAVSGTYIIDVNFQTGKFSVTLQ